jgi:hypothetical protein
LTFVGVDHDAELCVGGGTFSVASVATANEIDGLWAYATSASFSRRVICFTSHERFSLMRKAHETT